MKIDTYKFMGAINPTAKKIENGKATDELYKKETIYNAISGAISDGRIKKSLKVVDESKEYKKYIFSTKDQNIEVLIPNSDVDDGNLNIGTPSKEVEEYIKKIAINNSNNDYISKFDQLIKLRIKIMAKNIGLVLAGCAIAGTITGGMVYTDFKEYELNRTKNQNYVDEINEKRHENGVDPINYLEQTVDETIEETNLGGRKL